MNLPPIDELVPFTQMRPDYFQLLHTMYGLAQGKTGVIVTWREMGGYDPLMKGIDLEQQGYISLMSEVAIARHRNQVYGNSSGAIVGATLKQRAVEEINFAAIKSRRHGILKSIYHKTGSDSSQPVVVDDMAGELQCDVKSFRAGVRYLISHGLLHLVSQTHDGEMSINITASGIASVEGGGSQSGGINIVNIDQNITHGPNSPIQNRSQHSTQSVSVTITKQNREELAKLIPLIRADVPRLGLSEPEAKDVEAQLRTIEGQLDALKPKPSIIASCLQSVIEAVKAKAIEKGGEAAFAWLSHLPQITALMQNLPSL